MTSNKNPEVHETETKWAQSSGATAAYCAELQRWLWRCYWGNVSWQSGVSLSTFPCLPPPPRTSAQTPAAPAAAPGGGQQIVYDPRSWYGHSAFGPPASSPPHRGGAQTDGRSAHQQDGNPHQAGASLSPCFNLNIFHPDVMSGS